MFSTDLTPFIQRADLEAMRRTTELRAALVNHIAHLSEGAGTLVLLVDLIDASSDPLRKGAMPEWYEEMAHEVGVTIRAQADRLLVAAHRLDEEYLG